MRPRHVIFAAGDRGAWTIERIVASRGSTLPAATHLDVLEGHAPTGMSAWVLRGVTSNERYVTRAEQEALASRQPPLGRASATRAALIPIHKTDAWWALAQDERRRIFEERSRHVATGLRYLPAVARRLHHSRDLGEPFDFLTWFEFAPEDEPAFDELVALLRDTAEWAYVDREVEVRVAR